jgi:UDP-2,3-diacylglucosamine pyrophosphatase LpxH
MTTHHYLVVSDLHLCDIEDHADGWKHHKSGAWVFDTELEAMVQSFLDRLSSDDKLTFVLNGDIFDFDLVTAVPESPAFAVRSTERHYGLDATAAKSAWKLERILDDHPVFVHLLARLMVAGHRVVLVIGNHDRELCFPEVAAVLRQRIAAVTASLLATTDTSPEAVADLADLADLVIEPWFFCAPGEIYVEHGHQYDFYSSFQYNLEPLVEMHGEPSIALSTGNLSNRYLLSNIGFFNPHATDFILSGYGYLRHWLRHYAFSRRMLMFTWFIGSVRALVALFRIRSRLKLHPPRDYERHVHAAGLRYGLEPGLAERLHAMACEPITSRFHKIVREYWIDRVLLSVALTGATIAIALSGAALWVKLVLPLAVFPLLWLLYAWLAGTNNALTTEYRSHVYARGIAALVPVKAVVFGHTHDASTQPLSRDTTFANSGTWAPSWTRDGHPVPGLRNYVIVRVHHRTNGATCESDVAVGSWLPLEPGPLPPRAPARTTTPA